ncbi:hypothetical protein O181_017655 [Austropuccinia psidii MF-1]|uniref:Tf2-1-like SH3-like domain-containing protein n=1 Tax=Austropuccinia psidii MF-1 TaxID=1389203 RepID=A0A9Q3GT86_9BASI|nr:hypothetical protein [Austropuccinia psidii MF-1]
MLKKVSTHAYSLKLPSQWKSIHPVFHISLLEPVRTSTIPNKHQEFPPLVIIEEEENGKSLKYCTESSREKNYGTWWNGKASVKTQKHSLGNQLKTSRIVLNLSRIFMLYILIIQDPIF